MSTGDLADYGSSFQHLEEHSKLSRSLRWEANSVDVGTLSIFLKTKGRLRRWYLLRCASQITIDRFSSPFLPSFGVFCTLNTRTEQRTTSTCSDGALKERDVGAMQARRSHWTFASVSRSSFTRSSSSFSPSFNRSLVREILRISDAHYPTFILDAV
ncbi:hypothetical protein SCHPADRAFT_932981 [Schizopora paradoxa]|uniref:Uncharacterized protein n=1 Tax=Schizopora paradoxa TaxID=27342 RepID=A0A0H2R5I1_9AGAM|nr:hypothetical protein SCHPADRAFT_932981 [Schizopora paradoxa]